MRPILLFLFLLPLLVRADDLTTRLRQLLPGDSPERVNERQYLYRQLDQFFTVLESQDRISRRPRKKQLKRIRARVGERLLKTPAGRAELTELFRSGRYDAATATAVYALTLEHFGIDYNVFVDHWESYLIANPEDCAVRLPDPSGKADTRRQARFRRDYLDLVRYATDTELPAPDEQAATKTFNRYYYDPTAALTFGQFAAYLQLRRARHALAAGDYHQTLALTDNAMKREERIAFLVLREAAKLQLAAQNRPEVEGNPEELFAQWTENPSNRYLPAALLNYFDDRQRLLLAENRTTDARDLLAEFRRSAPAGQQDWLLQLERLQQYRFLAHYQARGRYDLAKQLAEALYSANPEEPTYQYLLGEILLDGLRRTTIDAADLTRAVTATADRYPFIRRQDRYTDILLRQRAFEVRRHFDADNRAAATTALTEFRAALTDMPSGKDRNIWTMTAFLAASNYYFREGDYGVARAMVREGLGYDPENDYLLHRMSVLERY